MRNVKSKGSLDQVMMKPGIDQSSVGHSILLLPLLPEDSFLSLLFRNFRPLYKALRGIIRKPSDSILRKFDALMKRFALDGREKGILLAPIIRP